ncbi:Crp/Fnr family transcriptional regulator [Bacillus sp. CGMCC 1.16607]|uniref:Crp/Fnr family transcriptional regulator n=1 Tax=Bacillus sp. CGMCC 1.16607 TaxID=3351842 RepID=UPI00362BD26A
MELDRFSPQNNKISEVLKIAQKEITIKKGAYLFREGQFAEELFIIISGKIQIFKLNAEGRALSLRLCQKNDIIGELTLFTKNPKYFFNAYTIEDCKVAAINIELLEQSLLKNSKLATEFMKWMNAHYRKTITRFRDLVLHGRKGALYSTLIRLSNSYGEHHENGIVITVPLTNEDLASYTGSARENVSRMISQLRKMKIISINRKTITIHNLDFLKSEIACENCPVSFCKIE